MTIANVRDKLKVGLEQISGLKVYLQPPNNVAQLPCAIIDFDRMAANYEQPGNSSSWFFRVLLLLSKSESEKAYEDLDNYISKTGAKSIKASVEGQTVGDWVVVKRCENPGVINYMGATFYGAEFIIEAMDTE